MRQTIHSWYLYSLLHPPLNMEYPYVILSNCISSNCISWRMRSCFVWAREWGSQNGIGIARTKIYQNHMFGWGTRYMCRCVSSFQNEWKRAKRGRIWSVQGRCGRTPLGDVAKEWMYEDYRFGNRGSYRVLKFDLFRWDSFELCTVHSERTCTNSGLQAHNL